MSGQVWIGSELPEITALKARIAELEGERDAHKADADAFRDLAYQVPELIAERDAAREVIKAWVEHAELQANSAAWLGPDYPATRRRSQILWHEFSALLAKERDAAKGGGK